LKRSVAEWLMHRDNNIPPFPKMMGLPNMPPQDGINHHYLSLLMQEREKLAPFLEVLPFCARLLNDEIRRMESLADFLRGPSLSQNFLNGPYYSDPPPHPYPGPPMMPPHNSHPMGGGLPMSGGGGGGGGGPMGLDGPNGYPIAPPPRMRRKGGGPMVKLSERVHVPTDKYPEFNFVGRILGPRGTTIQQIQNDTGCKISVRGQGSLRTKEEEEQKLKSKSPGYEHLSEELHVLIEVEMPEEDANEALGRAKEIIDSLLVPPENSGGMDALKMQQLNELATIKNASIDGHNLNYPPEHRDPPGKQRRSRQNAQFYSYK